MDTDNIREQTTTQTRYDENIYSIHTQKKLITNGIIIKVDYLTK